MNPSFFYLYCIYLFLNDIYSIYSMIFICFKYTVYTYSISIIFTICNGNICCTF
ncbi:hypothetical protein C1646_682585 [Rhizophagus diaphanus]|nr:hypothetical protein C1646_682585 [Rhizophagus diaphanus] [Rhizophagus sp. MUCL 43196]